MIKDRNRTSVLRQLQAIQRMPIEELHEKWLDLYGTEPPGYGPVFMKKRLAFRVQELFYGGMPEDAQRKLKYYMDIEAGKLSAKEKAGLPNKTHTGNVLPGTRLIRHWHGNKYEVIVREQGYEYEGQIYRSLSAIATKITGTKWNGITFFKCGKTTKK